MLFLNFVKTKMLVFLSFMNKLRYLHQTWHWIINCLKKSLCIKSQLVTSTPVQADNFLPSGRANHQIGWDLVLS